jgi:signal transduction histidine kinase
MKYRADTIGGQLTVERAQPRGLVVSCRVPLTGFAMPKPQASK